MGLGCRGDERKVSSARIAFDHSYAGLPENFFAEVRPESAPAPALIKVNRPLALELGLDVDWLESPEGGKI